MGRLSELLDALFPEGNPEERARTLRVIFRVVVAVHLLYAWNLLSPVGFTGFAKANEIDEKIAAAVTPVQAQLKTITVQLEMQDEVLRSIRVDQLSTKLRELKRTLCLTGTADQQISERLQADIEKAQLEYYRLTGGRYPIPECAR
jgi:hypothetical protein